MRKFIYLVILLLILQPIKVSAQETPGLSVTPTLLKIDLRKENSDSVIYYSNISKGILDIHLRAKDFNGLDDVGKVNFLDEQDSKNYQYSLSSWIQFETENISLNPGERKGVKIHIKKEQLPIGGHYAADLAEFGSKNENATISLHGVISTLLFVRAGKGFEHEEARITDYNTETGFPAFPESFFFKINNTGNIDITPYGTIDIYDVWGKLVTRGIVNGGSLVTLPESIRKYTVQIKTNSTVLPGMFTAKLHLQYGEKQKTLDKELTFFSQGSLPILNIIILIVVIGFAARAYKVWKRPFKVY